MTWVAIGSLTISGGNWSGVGPTYSAPATGQAIVVRDHNATSITHATGTFDVTAPLPETITVNTPSGAFAGMPVTLSGTYANGTPASFDYSLDGGVTWSPLANVNESAGAWSGTVPNIGQFGSGESGLLQQTPRHPYLHRRSSCSPSPEPTWD
jgi:hypothetical protein